MAYFTAVSLSFSAAASSFLWLACSSDNALWISEYAEFNCVRSSDNFEDVVSACSALLVNSEMCLLSCANCPFNSSTWFDSMEDIVSACSLAFCSVSALSFSFCKAWLFSAIFSCIALICLSVDCTVLLYDNLYCSVCSCILAFSACNCTIVSSLEDNSFLNSALTRCSAFSLSSKDLKKALCIACICVS